MNPDPIFAQIRANVAFEHMVMAALIAAAASGGVVFVFQSADAIFSGRWTVSALFGAAYNAMLFSFVAFLIGFFAAVSIGLPLFLMLERVKLRKVWPYAVAGLAIELVAAGFVLKRIPLATDFASLENAPLLLPGLLAALIFGRRMRPLWKAAERSGEPFPPCGGPARLH